LLIYAVVLMSAAAAHIVVLALLGQEGRSPNAGKSSRQETGGSAADGEKGWSVV